MAHNLFVLDKAAYDGELALAREAQIYDSHATDRMQSHEPEPKLVFRVNFNGQHKLVTDQVAVCRLTMAHPESTVEVIPIVA